MQLPPFSSAFASRQLLQFVPRALATATEGTPPRPTWIVPLLVFGLLLVILCCVAVLYVRTRSRLQSYRTYDYRTMRMRQPELHESQFEDDELDELESSERVGMTATAEASPQLQATLTPRGVASSAHDTALPLQEVRIGIAEQKRQQPPR